MNCLLLSTQSGVASCLRAGTPHHRMVNLMIMNLQEFFNKRPVFTHGEFAAFFNSKESRSMRTKEALLGYYTRKGRLLHLKRGLYAVVPPGVDLKAFPVDPFLLAAKMTRDAVLATTEKANLHCSHLMKKWQSVSSNTLPWNGRQ